MTARSLTSVYYLFIHLSIIDLLYCNKYLAVSIFFYSFFTQTTERRIYIVTDRQLKSLETRKKILEKGKELIQRKGYEAITIADITKECGIAKGTFYCHFKTKEDFLQFIEREPYAEFNDNLVISDNLSLIQKIQMYITNRLSILAQNDIEFNRQWVRNSASSRISQAQNQHNAMDHTADYIRKFFTDALEKEEILPSTPIEEFVLTINFALTGTTVYSCITDGNFTIMSWAESFCQFLTTILTPFLTQKKQKI